MESEPFKNLHEEARQVKKEMISRDMRRDELVLPERRWPYLSTRAPVARTPPPDLQSGQASTPPTGDTMLSKARRARLEGERLEARHTERRVMKQQRDRVESQKRATKEVAEALKRLSGMRGG